MSERARKGAELFDRLFPNTTKELSLRETGKTEAWSLAESVKMLVNAAEILLHQHDYDGAKHEDILIAKQSAEKYLTEAGFDL